MRRLWRIGLGIFSCFVQAASGVAVMVQYDFAGKHSVPLSEPLKTQLLAL